MARDARDAARGSGLRCPTARGTTSMKSLLNSLRAAALIVAVVAAALVLPTVWIHGAVWASDKVLPALNVFSDVAFLISILAFVPLAVFESTRVFASGCLLIASFIFGACVWTTGLLLTYAQWGAFGV